MIKKKIELNESKDLIQIANEWNQSEIGTDSNSDFDDNCKPGTLQSKKN